MALNFTDTQIKNISQDALLLPTVIDDPINDSGYIQQQQKVIDSQDNLLETDEQNAVFSDNFISIISAYHDELILLNSEERTLYDSQNIIDGSEGNPPHYPQNWLQLTPKVIDSNNGQPITALSIDNEQDFINRAQEEFDELKNGFSDGSADVQTTSTSNTSVTVASGDESGFSVGDNIVIDESNTSIYGEITNIDTSGTEPIIEFNNLSGNVTLASVARLRNFYPGFTDSERGHQTTPDAPEYRDYLESLIDGHVSDWKSNLSSQQMTLQSNDALGSLGTENDSALTNVNDALTVINDWQALPVVDTSGKYTDSGSSDLLTKAGDRENTQIPARISEIDAGLGNVSQDPNDGSFTGNNTYLNLFKWIDIRIAKSGGSLYSAKNLEQGIKLFDEKISKAEEQLSQYNDTFAITRILEDTGTGETIFTVDSTAEFSASQTVKVMDNQSSVFTRTIDNVTSSEITLNSGIPAELTQGQLARIVRQK